MRPARQGRQRIAWFFFHKRRLFRVESSFGLAICHRSDTLPSNWRRKWRFRSVPSGQLLCRSPLNVKICPINDANAGNLAYSGR
jgi:hypothetical protein